MISTPRLLWHQADKTWPPSTPLTLDLASASCPLPAPNTWPTPPPPATLLMAPRPSLSSSQCAAARWPPSSNLPQSQWPCRLLRRWWRGWRTSWSTARWSWTSRWTRRLKWSGRCLLFLFTGRLKVFWFFSISCSDYFVTEFILVSQLFRSQRDLMFKRQVSFMIKNNNPDTQNSLRKMSSLCSQNRLIDWLGDSGRHSTF